MNPPQEGEPEGRGGAWTDERGTSKEGNRRLTAHSGPAASTLSVPEERGRGWAYGPGPNGKAGRRAVAACGLGGNGP